MSNTYQAKSGFKSFILTLSLSLVIFSALYYVVTDVSKDVDIEKRESDEKVVLNTKDSIFGKLSEQKLDRTEQAVLAGATTTEEGTPGTLDAVEEATESTVPVTGSNTFTGITIGFGFLTVALYIIFSGPRRMALIGFEKKVVKNL